MTKRWFWTFWLLGAALAFGPEAALEQKPVGYSAAVLDAVLSGWEEAFARTGIGGSARVGYGEDWNYGLSLQLSFDSEPRLRATLAALEARRGLRAQVRQAVHDALTLHARAWRARVDLEIAELAVQEAELRLEAARSQGRGPLDLDELTYRAEDARVGLVLAQAELAAVQEEAHEAGLSGPAEPRVLRFALPKPRPDVLGALKLDRQRAAAAKAARGLVALSAQARYLGATGYAFEVASAGPNLTFSLQHPAAPATQEWKFSVAARIALDPAAWTGARRAQLTAERMALERSAQERERERRLVLMEKRAAAAWKRLELARKRAGLSGARAEQLDARLAEGLVSRLDAVAAKLDALRARAQTADAWRAYVDAVKAYLDLADGEWRVE